MSTAKLAARVLTTIENEATQTGWIGDLEHACTTCASGVVVSSLNGGCLAAARRSRAPGQASAIPPGTALSRDVVRAGLVTFTLMSPDLDVASAIMFRLRGSSTLDDLLTEDNPRRDLV